MARPQILPYVGAMGIFDKFKDEAEKAVDEHGAQISEGVDKAAGMVDDKTGGRYTDKIDKGADAAKTGLDKLDGKDDDIPDA
jgi:MT0933-like antitoxin protein